MIIGNHLWEKCADCGKLVKVTGWLRGLHLCLTPDEINHKREMAARMQYQQRTRSANNALIELLMKGRADR